MDVLSGVEADLPIELDSRCRARLVECVAEALNDVTVENGNLVSLRSCVKFAECDGVIPSQGKTLTGVKKQLCEYVGDEPVRSFLVDQVYQHVYDNFPHESSKDSIPLSMLNGYDNLLDVANTLIVSLQSLPWNYTSFVRLTKSLSDSSIHIVDEHKSRYEISRSLALIRPNETVVSFFPVPSSDRNPLAAVFLGPASFVEPWDPDSLYLQLSHSGYVSRLGTSMPLRQAVSDIKSFVGLGIAAFLLDADGQTQFTYALGIGGMLKKRMIIYRQIAASWQWIASHDLPTETSKLLDRITIHEFSNLKGFDRYTLSSVGHTRHSSILGIGKLLANRCAYLIGENYSERESGFCRTLIRSMMSDRLSFTAGRYI